MKKKITDHFESVMFDTLSIGLLPVIELLTITYLFNEVCYRYVVIYRLIIYKFWIVWTNGIHGWVSVNTVDQ